MKRWPAHLDKILSNIATTQKKGRGSLWGLLISLLLWRHAQEVREAKPAGQDSVEHRDDQEVEGERGAVNLTFIMAPFLRRMRKLD